MSALVALALAGVVAMVWWLAAGTDPEADGAAGRGRVLLAFANETGDATLGHALELALALQIESDPTLVVLSDERVKALLHRAGRGIGGAASALVTPETAASVCAEAGASAVLNGLVKQVAGRFVLTLEASTCAAGAPIARQEADVVGAEQVLAELRRMATHIRRSLIASLGAVPGHAAREPGQLPPTPAARSLGGV